MNLHKEEHIIVQNSITEALFLLMDEKPFSTISITELINKAGVARATYYRNYSSKEEIIEKLIDQIFIEFRTEYPIQNFDDRFRDGHFDHILDYVLRYREQIRILHKSGLSSLYLNGLNRYLVRSCHQQITEQQKILLYSFAGAEFNLIFNYFLTNPKLNKKILSNLLRQQLTPNFYKKT